jgi:NAD(P)-dependent dehydrogenase (short-subunit alcohol dehydrogenase family)
LKIQYQGYKNSSVISPQPKKDSIVNISSAYGKAGGPTAAVYVGSKHAVEGITKSAAIELAGTGVRINIVGPGPVETGMFNRFAQTKENKANFLDAQVPNKRIGTPKELPMPSCSLALTRHPTSSAHPWRSTEE